MKNLKFILAFLLIAPSAFAQTQHDRIDARGQVKTDKFINRATIIITGATPDVSNGNVFKTNNPGIVTVTNFLNGADSQIITINCGDANTTVQNNAHIVNTSGADFICGVNKTISYVYDAAQGKWVQSGTGSGGGGGGGSPGTPNLSVQCNNAGNFGACNATDSGTTFSINESTVIGGDTTSQGPNPWGDIRNYGKFATASSTTASTTSGSPNVTLAAASNFKNGEYMTVFNAGVSCGLATPATPTVTPSVNAGGLNTTAASAGASSFAYEIRAQDKNGCYTVVSPSGSTSSGNALGIQSATVTTWTRSGTTVTVNTSAAHGFVATQLIHFRYFTSTDILVEGFWIVNTVPTSTSFTFISSTDANRGALASGTGGTVQGFNVNTVTWTAVTNAWKYFVYGRTGGTFNLLGQTTTNSWVDYGATMNDSGQQFPPFIPTTNAASGKEGFDHLTAKILSGGGTTSITLASNAGVTTSGVTALSDDGPAIVAAASGQGFGGVVYIPNTGATVNSYTLMPHNRVVFYLYGNINANDTIETNGSRIQGWAGGSQSAFGHDTLPSITSNIGYPMLYLNGPQQMLKDVSILCGAANGCLEMLINGTNITFSNVEMAESNGTGNYLGLAGLFTIPFSFTWRGGLLSGGTGGPNDNTNIGLTPVPTIVFQGGTSSDYFSDINFLGRAAMAFDFQSPQQTGIGFKNMFSQSLQEPAIQFTGFAGNTNTMDLSLDGWSSADRATALVGIYTSHAAWVGMTLKDIAPCLTGGHQVVVGIPVSTVTQTNVCGGPGTSTVNLGGGISTDGFVNGGVVQSPLSVLPTFNAVVSAGGSVPVASQIYNIQYLDVNGNTTAPSVNVTAVTTGGNQTVTITPTSVPAGVVSYWVYRNGARQRTSGCFPTAIGTSFVDTLSFIGCGNGIAPANAGLSTLSATGLTGPGVTLVNSGGFVSTITSTGTANRAFTLPDAAGVICASGGCAVNAVTINGDAALSANPRSTPPIFFPGALTTTWTAASWTLDKAITVTRVQSAAKVSPSGCSTSAIVRVTDGLTPINLTINSGTNDSGVISQNYAAGATLTVSIQTAAATCTTAPGDLNVSIQSRMQ